MFTRKVNLRVKVSQLECGDKNVSHSVIVFIDAKSKKKLSRMKFIAPGRQFPGVWAGNSIIVVDATKEFPSLSNYPTPTIGLESNTGSNMINAFSLSSPVHQKHIEFHFSQSC